VALINWCLKFKTNSKCSWVHWRWSLLPFWELRTPKSWCSAFSTTDSGSVATIEQMENGKECCRFSRNWV
jgi:hypothetical protein